MKLIILGAPGSGKGTQAQLIAKKLNLKHISVGDLLRVNINSKTEIGIKSSELIQNGSLVPDEIITRLLKENLPENNFILDGYPRSLNQAKILDDFKINLDKIILLELEDKIIIKRITGRKICPECNAMYHDVFNPSRKKDLCDLCNTKLVQRLDDKINIIQERLIFYRNSIHEIIDFYIHEKNFKFNNANKNKHEIIKINGDASINQVFKIIIQNLI